MPSCPTGAGSLLRPPHELSSMSRRATPSPPRPDRDTAAELIAAAEAFVPHVRAAREECERLRHVPPAMAEAMARAQFLQMYMPKALGGPQVSPLTAYRVVETISRADGSIGWCAMIATAQSAYGGWLPLDIGRAMAGNPADLRLAGSIRPLGKATPVPGGYRVSGQWDFASGIHHATWLLGTSMIMDGEKPRKDANGAPVWRIMWIPKAQVRIEDTWHVVGLRGTGSHDFVVEDVFVPSAHSTSPAEPPQHGDPHYNPRLHATWAWTATVANSLGIARGAMDAFADMATTKSSTMSSALLRDRPLVQARTAEAEAIINAARAYVLDTVGRAWDLANGGEGDLDAVIMQARLAITHGMHEARRAVDLLFHAAGTNAVYTRGPLERCFRDIHVAIQHGAALPVHMESAGKVLLGLRPTDPGW